MRWGPGGPGRAGELPKSRKLPIPRRLRSVHAVAAKPHAATVQDGDVSVLFLRGQTALRWVFCHCKTAGCAVREALNCSEYARCSDRYQKTVRRRIVKGRSRCASIPSRGRPPISVSLLSQP